MRNRWVTGKCFGIPIPAEPEALMSAGSHFLTQAFRASAALAPENSVKSILGSQEFSAGGTGRKLLVTVEYEFPEPGLPDRLFIKFSRNFNNELWDRARSSMTSEVDFALLSRSPSFPVRVPFTLFADIDCESFTGLIISECISYGENGVERCYPKCMDYSLPDPLAHYDAIVRGLASLSGAHREGKLGREFELKFPYIRDSASSFYGSQVSAAKVAQRADRMFDFIDSYPNLFPNNVRTTSFRRQFERDIPDVLAASDRITEVLHGNPDFIAFAHWNANIDNCWFWREPDGLLNCGFLDWANAAQLNVAQSIAGSVGGAEQFIWDEHLDELLRAFIDKYSLGGPRLDLDETRLHVLLSIASRLPYAMGAPIALSREIDDISALESREDRRLAEHENARIQLHLTTTLLNVWETRALGDVVRAL
jgi:hypothetical protein